MTPITVKSGCKFKPINEPVFEDVTADVADVALPTKAPVNVVADAVLATKLPVNVFAFAVLAIKLPVNIVAFTPENVGVAPE